MVASSSHLNEKTFVYKLKREFGLFFQRSTDGLIDMYHLERLEQQQVHLTADTPLFGVLTVRVYFNHDCLFVEVLKARDILPLDSNGKIRVETECHISISLYQQLKKNTKTIVQQLVLTNRKFSPDKAKSSDRFVWRKNQL